MPRRALLFTMDSIDSLLNNLEAEGKSDEALQETLGDIKKHLIQFAHASRSVLRSQEFFRIANS